MKSSLQINKNWFFIFALFCNFCLFSNSWAAEYDLTFEVTLPADAPGPAIIVSNIASIGWNVESGAAGTMALKDGSSDTYTITVSVEEGFEIGYRFLKGYGHENDEKTIIIANGCAPKWGEARKLVMPAEATMTSHTWAECDNEAKILTAKVDMTGYDTQYGVYIYGASTGWMYEVCTQEGTSDIWAYDFPVSEGTLVSFAFCLAKQEITGSGNSSPGDQQYWDSYYRETVPSFISDTKYTPRSYRKTIATADASQVYDCVFATALPAGTIQSSHEVTFLVDMTGQTISSEGIYVMGNFDIQDGAKPKWATAQMTQVGSSNFYEYNITMEYGQNETFRFSNGYGDGANLRETLPVECRVADNNQNREFVIPAGDVTIGYKYGSCETAGLPTAIGDIATEDFTVYPNPATDVINVVGAKEVTILNLSGKIIKKSTESVISVADLEKGLYFVRAGKKVIKLVKK